MSHVVDLTGMDFGYLYVIGRDTSKKGDTAHWICRCKCGTICTKDGAKTLVPNPTIQIIGRPETEVVTTGKLQISKKDFTTLTNRAAALLELFLHGFMQERKELEAAQE